MLRQITFQPRSRGTARLILQQRGKFALDSGWIRGLNAAQQHEMVVNRF
jgi:hypothetical protein